MSPSTVHAHARAVRACVLLATVGFSEQGFAAGEDHPLSLSPGGSLQRAQACRRPPTNPRWNRKFGQGAGRRSPWSGKPSMEKTRSSSAKTSYRFCSCEKTFRRVKKHSQPLRKSRPPAQCPPRFQQTLLAPHWPRSRPPSYGEIQVWSRPAREFVVPLSC